MQGSSLELLNLIKKNKTLNEISVITGLSPKQLPTKINMLKQCGYLIDRKYHYNGEIEYGLKSPWTLSDEVNKLTLNIPPHQKKITMMLTSDNHLGSIYEAINAQDKMVELCLQKGINIILNGGDFFHGIYPSASKQENLTRYKDTLLQIKYGLQVYPYDKNLITFTCLGNHDASFGIEEGLDLKTILLDRRPDIVPLGYGHGLLDIDGTHILIQHPISRLNIIPPNLPRIMTLRGHSHKFKIQPFQSGLIINPGTISYVPTAVNENPIPSIAIMELTRDINGIVEKEYFEHYLFLQNEFIKVGEMLYDAIIPNQKTNPNNNQTSLTPIFNAQSVTNIHEVPSTKKLSRTANLNTKNVYPILK